MWRKFANVTPALGRKIKGNNTSYFIKHLRRMAKLGR